jgi:hypothetical protein
MCVPDSEQCPCQSIPPGAERILLTRFLLAPVAAIGAGPVLPSTARPGPVAPPAKPRQWRLQVQYRRGGGASLVRA